MTRRIELNECLDLFELTLSASYEDAKRAYIAKIQKWHPDRYEQYPPLQQHAVTMTKKLNLAIEILSEILPEYDSVEDQQFSASFDYNSADWSNYYSNSSFERAEPVTPVPEETITIVPQPTPGILHRVWKSLTMPFKLISDLAIFVILDKPLVPLIAIAMLYGHLITDTSKILISYQY